MFLTFFFIFQTREAETESERGRQDKGCEEWDATMDATMFDA